MRNNNLATSTIIEDPEIKYMYNPESRYAFATYGCQCEDGWASVIVEGLRAIAAVDHDKILRIDQIKEKFGSLRLYMNFPDGCPQEFYEQVTAIISDTEHKAYHICESCGTAEGVSTGSISETRRYIQTLCGSCRSSK